MEFFNSTNVVMGTNFGGFDVFWPDQLVQPERNAEKIAQNIADLQEQLGKLKARLDAMGTGSNDEARMTWARGGYHVTYNQDAEKDGCPAGQFVSAIDINWVLSGTPTLPSLTWCLLSQARPLISHGLRAANSSCGI